MIKMTNTYTAADMAADERTEPTRPPLNGYELVGHLKQVDDVGYYVVLDRQATYRTDLVQRYVVAWVDKLTDPTWYSGHYTSDLYEALDNMVQRATGGRRQVTP